MNLLNSKVMIFEPHKLVFMVLFEGGQHVYKTKYVI